MTAGDRNRTGTVFPQQDFKSCASASSATPAKLAPIKINAKWMEKDSNLRSRRQQIYSLPPLAAREPIHARYLGEIHLPIFFLTRIIYIIFLLKMQEAFVLFCSVFKDNPRCFRQCYFNRSIFHHMNNRLRSISIFVSQNKPLHLCFFRNT